MTIEQAKVRKKLRLFCVLLASVVACAVALHALAPEVFERHKRRGPGAIPLAIVGDSNSHSYHDSIMLSKPSVRGGTFRASTWQWTEVLQELRPESFDQGDFRTWGSKIKLAELLDAIGVGGRAPRKRDFRFNFAVSAAQCDDLFNGYYRQVPRLLSEMRRDREFWNGGIVVIYMGVNSMGQPPHLESYAKHGLTPENSKAIDNCVAETRRAVEAIRREIAGIRIVLVGIFDGTGEPGAIQRWQTPEEMGRIRMALARFDNGLRQIADSDKLTVFFDLRNWAIETWGIRADDGSAQFRDMVLPSGMRVRFSIGDDPSNAVLRDEHAGTVWNALFARSLVSLLNQRFQLGIREIELAEVSTLPNRTVPLP
ncbi:MAG: hypothetical protein JNK75_07180 [Betaproteobacteria bacterium]|nr:hypothetical protein [Betaproteobacteria bacterium]